MKDGLLSELKAIHRQIGEASELVMTLSVRANKLIEEALSDLEKGSSVASSDTEIDSKSPLTVFTDGACSGNPGDAGSGVVIMQGTDIVHEISESLGHATNNIAELTAIKLALEYLEGHQETPITLFTDSVYCIGMLTKGHKAKANAQLIDAIKKLQKGFTDLSMRHVKGHSGDSGNERADELAVMARDDNNGGQYV